MRLVEPRASQPVAIAVHNCAFQIQPEGRALRNVLENQLWRCPTSRVLRHPKLVPVTPALDEVRPCLKSCPVCFKIGSGSWVMRQVHGATLLLRSEEHTSELQSP